MTTQITTIPLKKCKSCRKNKPLYDFYKNSRYYDSYRSECKKCVIKRNTNNRLIKGLAFKPLFSDQLAKQLKVFQKKRTIEDQIKYNYTRATVWLNDELVMRNGVVLHTELAQQWWNEKPNKARKWKRLHKGDVNILSEMEV